MRFTSSARAARAASLAPVPDPSGAPTRAEELVQRCARGDDTAFAQLYDDTSARVFGLIVRVLRDPAQSEEVLQETYLDIWRHSARYDVKQASAMSWMMTIAHRRAVDRVRHAETASAREGRYAVEQREVAFDSTSEAVVSSLEAERVRRAMATLTPVQREALELAYFGGHTHTEVAALLDLPLGTAKTRIRDGLIRLRDTMGGER